MLFALLGNVWSQSENPPPGARVVQDRKLPILEDATPPFPMVFEGHGEFLTHFSILYHQLFPSFVLIPERIGDKIMADDVLLTESQYDFLFRNNSNRNADPAKKWPNGVVPYTISGFNSHHIARIEAGIKYLNDNLQGCITVR